MEFRVLGPLEVLRDGEAITKGAPKQRALLALLLIHAGEVLSTDRILDELWDESPPEGGPRTIQFHVSKLRDSLEPKRARGEQGTVLLTRAPGYVLVAEPESIDAGRFERMATHAHVSLSADPTSAATTLREALSLWRGPAFDDFTYESFAQAEITRLEELRLSAVEDRIEADLALGRHQVVISELGALTQEYPLRERLRALLMTALYRSGRQVEALRVYQRTRTLLGEELGVEPSPDLRKLEKHILLHDPSLAATPETPSAAVPTPEVGRGIRGYELRERIGAGTHGVVFRAYQPSVGREVAIKAIRPEYANDPEFVRRFETEAQLVARLEHPHIVPLYDYWRDPEGAYLVMRWYRQGSVRQALERGSFNSETAARVVGQIADALTLAHAQGVVHRDIKPSNILLDQEGNAYLSDFGIAGTFAELTPSPEQPAVAESSAYRSPEETQGATVSPQSDLYSLGMVAFALMTGRGLDISEEAGERDAARPLPAITKLRPDLPEAVNEVIGRATAPDFRHRYPDPASFARAFRRALGLAPEPPLEASVGAEVRNPYKGLHPFGEIDASDFFGRDALVARLASRLSQQGVGGRFLAVVGPSGSGKSSVVKAGLVPALRRGAVPGSENWFIVDVVPGAYPMEEVEAALLRIALDPLPSLLDQLERDSGGLRQVVKRILPAEDPELLLVIDQFEELFTLVEEDRRQHFLESVVEAVTDPRGRLRVVITLRADFYDRPLRYPGFSNLVSSHLETVQPLNPEELERAITGPAEQVGVSLKHGLVAEVIADVASQPGALPLLQYALTELFDHRRNKTLDLEAYAAIGGVRGALGRRAEELYGGLDPGAQDAARQLFLRLVTLGEGTEDTRRRVLKRELATIADQRRHIDKVLDMFGAARLLSFDRDPLTRSPTVEVAHEALLREWDRLRQWIDAAREDLRMHRRLTAASAEWIEASHDPGFLLSGSRLAQFQSWAGESDLSLTKAEQTYLEGSVAQEAAAQQRSTRRRRAILTGLSAATVVAVVLALFAFSQRSDARRQADVAEEQTAIAREQATIAGEEARRATARELAAAAIANLQVDSDLSVLLALEAVETTRSVDGTALRESQEALHQAVQAHRLLYTVPGDSAIAAYSPDGTRLVTGGERDDASVTVRDARAGEKLFTLEGHTDSVNDAAYSPDGTRIATASKDATAKLWNAAAGTEEATLTGHAFDVVAVTFSPDGTLLATAGAPANVRVWDVATSQELFSLDLPGPAVETVAFSSDGSQLAIGRFDGIVEVRNIRTGEHVHALPAHGFPVRRVAYSADAPLLASTSAPDGTLKIWNTTTGDLQFTLFVRARALRFSSDGTRLATGSREGLARVWEMTPTGARELFTLPSHTDIVDKVAFSPDGTRLATASFDGSTKVWDVSSAGGGEWLRLPGLSPWFGDVAFSPGGELLAASADGAKVKVWDPATGAQVFLLEGHDPEAPTEGSVMGIAFSRDTSVIATSSADTTVRLWTAEGQEVAVLEAHESIVSDVALNADRSLVASVSFDGTLRLWDPATGELLRTEPHEDGVIGVAFSPDGTRVATATFGGPVRVFGMDPDEEFALMSPDQPCTGGLAFDSAGTRLAVGCIGGAAIWDLATRERLIRVAGHRGDVTAAIFSPDDVLLATAGDDGRIKLWEASTGDELVTLTEQPLPVPRIAFHPEGKLLAAIGTDGAVSIFVVPIDDLVSLARNRITRSLTNEECQQFLRVEACPPG